MTKKLDLKIPFDSDVTVMLSYAPHNNKGVVWHDNKVFNDTLVMTSYSKGRSAVKISFMSATDQTTYSMFLGEFWSMLTKLKNQDLNINKMEVTGRWTFVKRGTDYSISFVGPLEVAAKICVHCDKEVETLHVCNSCGHKVCKDCWWGSRLDWCKVCYDKNMGIIGG